MRGSENRGRAVVLAAPTGGGKTTIARLLVDGAEDFVFSVSATTRPPRPGEVDGRDYVFLTPEEFRARVERGEMAEWAEVHGHLYGTPRVPLEEALRRGRHVVLDIDVQGARQVRETLPDSILVFILPPSVRTLLERLRARGTEDDAAILRRLETARLELREAHRFDHLVVNDELPRVVEEIRTLVRTGAPPGGRASGASALVETLQADVDRILAAGSLDVEL